MISFNWFEPQTRYTPLAETTLIGCSTIITQITMTTIKSDTFFIHTNVRHNVKTDDDDTHFEYIIQIDGMMIRTIDDLKRYHLEREMRV